MMAKRAFVPKTREEQIAESAREMQARCLHFRGVVTRTCAVGCVYEEVRLTHAPIPYRSSSGHEYQATRSLPCNDRINYGGATCAKREVPTEAEALARAAQQHDEMTAFVAHVGTARAAIVAATGNRGGRGAVACPACGGTVQYTQAASNKHVHARCVTTPGCLGWME